MLLQNRMLFKPNDASRVVSHALNSQTVCAKPTADEGVRVP